MFENWTIAPSSMTFADNPDHPWYGDLFLAGLRGKQIYRAQIEDGRIADEEVFYVSNNEKDTSLRLQDVNYHDRSLYILEKKDSTILHQKARITCFSTSLSTGVDF